MFVNHLVVFYRHLSQVTITKTFSGLSVQRFALVQTLHFL